MLKALNIRADLSMASVNLGATAVISCRPASQLTVGAVDMTSFIVILYSNVVCRRHAEASARPDHGHVSISTHLACVIEAQDADLHFLFPEKTLP